MGTTVSTILMLILYNSILRSAKQMSIWRKFEVFQKSGNVSEKQESENALAQANERIQAMQPELEHSKAEFVVQMKTLKNEMGAAK